jgi:hypothetical protein
VAIALHDFDKVVASVAHVQEERQAGLLHQLELSLEVLELRFLGAELQPVVVCGEPREAESKKHARRTSIAALRVPSPNSPTATILGCGFPSGRASARSCWR